MSIIFDNAFEIYNEIEKTARARFTLVPKPVKIINPEYSPKVPGSGIITPFNPSEIVSAAGPMPNYDIISRLHQ